MAAKAPREQIIEKANEVILSKGYTVRHLTMRHLNEAVCIVRRAQAITPSVLVAAGFNPTGKK